VPPLRRAESDRSTASSTREAKKNATGKAATKQRNSDRRRKQDFLEDQVEIGHIVAADDDNLPVDMPPPPQGFKDMMASTSSGSTLDRSSSDQSTGSLLYGKTPNSGALLGKSSSLIFPTGVETTTDGDSEVDQAKRRKINLLLDQCEAMRFPFKKKLTLEKLGIAAVDIPLNYLCGTPLGNSLHKLTLAGNRLGSIPAKLVQNLPTLKHLDFSQCELHQLPSNWNLPQLKKLNLSHNRLRDFPDEVRARSPFSPCSVLGLSGSPFLC
jgi:Leucine-rich repeat (LRR) protein